MSRFIHAFPLLAFCPLAAAIAVGCASVDPRADYEQARQSIAEATGRPDGFHPADDGDIDTVVAAMLADGLTADEAVRTCLLNNRDLQAAWLQIGMARADFVQAGLLANPSIGGSLRFPDGGGLANLEFTLAQNIADLWLMPARRQAAQAGVERAILDLAARAAAAANDAAAAYYHALGASELHDIAGDNLVITRQLLEMSLARQRAGAGSELDVNLSRATVLEAELAVESARLAEAEARRSLARRLGLEADADRIVLADSFPEPPAVAFDAAAVVAMAQANRLDILAARQAEAQAETRLREEILRVFPTVEIGLAMERDERRTPEGRNILADTARASVANGGLTAPEIEPRSARRSETNFMIGPSWGLELPIFNQNQAQIAKARFAREQAVKTREAVERAAVQEVRGAADRLATAWRIVAAYRERFLPLARSNLDLSRTSYAAGRASMLAVLEAQRFYLDTRRRAVEAQREAAETLPALAQAVGTPFGRIASMCGDGATTRPATQPATENQP